MKTISNREFVANPDLYMGLAKEQDVRIRRGRRVFHLSCEPLAPAQPVHLPDEQLRRAISMDEFKERALAMVDRLDDKYARR